MKIYIAFILSMMMGFTALADTKFIENDIVSIGKKTTTNPTLQFRNTTKSIRVNAGTSKLEYSNDGSSFKSLGSGSGGGEVNFITDGDAESSNIFTLSKNTSAAARPDTGFVTSGLTISTSIPSTGPPNAINGLKSFLLTKPASNAQGQQYVIPFTISEKNQAKVLTINTSYRVASGTFVSGSNVADGDLITYIAVLNPTSGLWELIEPSSIKFLSNSTTLVDTMQATFQTPIYGTSYKLIYHVASTSALAWGLQVDDIAISPSKYVYGTPKTYLGLLPTTGVWSSGIATYSGQYWKDGEFLEAIVSVTLTGTPTGNMNIYLPSGYQIDQTKMLFNQGGSAPAGEIRIRDAGTNTFIGSADAISGSPGIIAGYSIDKVVNGVVISGNITPTFPFTFVATDSLVFRYRVPIQGWASSVQMSDSSDQKVITATLTSSGTLALPHATEVKLSNLSSVQADSYGGADTANSRIYARTAGWYTAGTQVNVQSGNAAVFRSIHNYYKNNTFIASTTTLVGGVSGNGFSTRSVTDPYYLNAGDYIEMKAYQDSGASTQINSSSLNLTKVQGPNTTAANEKVVASYSHSTGQSFTTAVLAVVNFSNQIRDTHGSVTTGAGWKFVPPGAGDYMFCAQIRWSPTTSTDLRSFGIRKNGTTFRWLDDQPKASSANVVMVQKGCTTMYLIGSDYVDFIATQATGSNLTLVSDGQENYVDIYRIAN